MFIMVVSLLERGGHAQEGLGHSGGVQADAYHLGVSDGSTSAIKGGISRPLTNGRGAGATAIKRIADAIGGGGGGDVGRGIDDLVDHVEHDLAAGHGHLPGAGDAEGLCVVAAAVHEGAESTLRGGTVQGGEGRKTSSVASEGRGNDGGNATASVPSRTHGGLVDGRIAGQGEVGAEEAVDFVRRKGPVGELESHGGFLQWVLGTSPGGRDGEPYIGEALSWREVVARSFHCNRRRRISSGGTEADMDIGSGAISVMATRVWDAVARSGLQIGGQEFMSQVRAEVRQRLADAGRRGHTFGGGHSLIGARVYVMGRTHVMVESALGHQVAATGGCMTGPYTTRPVTVQALHRPGEGYDVIWEDGREEFFTEVEFTKRFASAL